MADRFGRAARMQIGPGGSVFLSHTSELSTWPVARSYVSAAKDAVNAAGMVSVEMGDFHAQDLSPAMVCEQRVLGAEVYVGVIGFRYGSLVPDLNISYTELEFDVATRAGIPRLVFLLRDPARDESHVDAERGRIDVFRSKLETSGIVLDWFDTADVLQYRLHLGLLGLLSEHGRRQAPGPGWLMAGYGGSEGVRAHFVVRGRGQRSYARGGDLFQGRTTALAAVRTWLDADEPPGRALVVTGGPGTGKSAVVARTVLDIEDDAKQAGATEAVGVAFHARDAVLMDLLDAVAFFTATQPATSVAGMIDRLSENASLPRLRVVVDALDESSEQARPGLVEALTELAALPKVRVVVATRPLASGDRFGPASLLTGLGVRSASDKNLIDLEDDQYADPQALVDFAVAVLTQKDATAPVPAGAAWEKYRADQPLRSRLAQAIATKAGRNFLIAALSADQLSRMDSAIDPAASGFDPTTLAGTIGEALEKYLASQPASQRELVRGLLVALAYARGGGVDDPLWLRFAAQLGFVATVTDLEVLRHTAAADFLLQSSAMDGAPPARSLRQTLRDGALWSGLGTGRSFAAMEADLKVLLDAFTTQRRSSTADNPTTRLFHQALADELLSDRVDRGYDERRLMAALVPAAPATWLDAGDYARAFAVDHAVAADLLADLLADPLYAAVADLDRLLPLLPDALPGDRALVPATLRTVAHQARDLPPERRARLLSLTAAHLGVSSAMTAGTGVGKPADAVAITTRWAHTLGAPHQILTGHIGKVLTVTTSRVGGRELIVSGGEDCTVRVWDAATGTPVIIRRGHTDPVRAVAIGRVGDRDVIVSGGDDATLRVWDAVTGHPVGPPLVGHATRAVATGRVGDRDVLVSGGYDTTVRVWDAVTGHPIFTPLQGHTGWVEAVALGRFGGRDVIVSSGYDATVRVWDAVTGHPICDPLKGRTGIVHAVAIGRVVDRDVIVCGGGGPWVQAWVWDPATGKPAGTRIDRDSHTDWVSAIAVGRVGDRDVIVCGGRRAVRVLDAGTGNMVDTPLDGHTGSVNAVAVGQTGGRDVIVSGGDDGTVRVWATGHPVGLALQGHTDLVQALAIGRVGSQYVIVSGGGGDDGTVRVWDTNTGQALGTPLKGYINPVRSVAVGRFGNRDVIVSGSLSVQVWNAANGRPVGKTWHGHGGVVTGVVAVGRIGGRDAIVSACDDGSVRVHRRRLGTTLTFQLTGHAGWATAMAVGRLGDRDVIVTGSDEGSVRVRDAATGRPVGAPVEGHDREVLAVAVGRAGGRDVIVSCDGWNVSVWNAATGQPLGAPLEGHTDWIRALATGRVADRDVFVSGGDDATVRIWDAATGREIAVQDTLDRVRAVALEDGLLAVATGRAVCAFYLQ